METLGPFTIEHADDRRIRIFKGDEKLIEIGFSEDVPKSDYVTKAFARVAIDSNEPIQITNDVIVDAKGNLQINVPIATLKGQPISAVVNGG